MVYAKIPDTSTETNSIDFSKYIKRSNVDLTKAKFWPWTQQFQHSALCISNGDIAFIVHEVSLVFDLPFSRLVTHENDTAPTK